MSISVNLTLSVSSARAEQPVPRVPQPGEDEAVLVELAVEGAGVHGDIRVRGEHGLHTLGGGAEAEEAHTRGPRPLERLHSGDGRSAGREHRVKHEERPALL